MSVFSLNMLLDDARLGFAPPPPPYGLLLCWGLRLLVFNLGIFFLKSMMVSGGRGRGGGKRKGRGKEGCSGLSYIGQ